MSFYGGVRMTTDEMTESKGYLMKVYFHLLLYFDEKDEFKILMLTVRTEITLIIVT